MLYYLHSSDNDLWRYNQVRLWLEEKVGRNTMLIIHHPVIIGEIKGKSGIVGYKVEPWLKTSREDMFIVNMDSVLTLSESSDMEMIVMYKRYLKDSENDRKNNSKINRRMGYLGNVEETKVSLEKLFKLDINKNTNS